MLEFILFWICGGLLGVPGYWAYQSREYRYSNEQEDLGICLFMAVVFGPIGSFATFMLTGFYRHGFKFWFDGDIGRRP